MNLTTHSISSRGEPPPGMPLSADADAALDVVQRIGVITRRLHDALRELGYDKTLESAADSLPDARARLAYIAKLTGDSANKVLNTVDMAQATQQEMSQGADALKARWRGKTAESLANADGEDLIAETREYLGSLSMSTQLTSSHLTEIMMAQDFHDLTGQVIRKVVDLAQTLEEQLLALLLESTPPDKRARVAAFDTSSLNGPVVEPAGRTDVVANQSQVDEMLESMGF
jgi:chemotaxis protein CheZ